MADYADPLENERIQREEASKPGWYSPTLRGHSPDQEAPGRDIHGLQYPGYYNQVPQAPVEEPNMNLPPPAFFEPKEENSAVVRPAVSDLVEVLDERGDLILVVGPESREFLVCSRTLRRASKTFETLYKNKYRDVDGHMRLVVKEIGVIPLHLILQVIHGNPTKVNEFMDDPNTLHDVLVVTHHFHMTHCLAPIAVKWLRKTYDKEPSGFHNIAVQLWITYQLGHLNCLKQTICCMVIGGRLNKKGELIGQGASENDPYTSFPTLGLLGILDQIKECRSRVVAYLVNMVRDGIKNLTQSPRQPAPVHTNGPAPRSTVCQAKQDAPVRRRQCDSRMLGPFMRALFDGNWDKIDHPSCSPYSIHRRITEVSRQTLKEYDSPSDLHKHCGPFGRREVEPLLPIVQREVDKIPFDEADFARRGTMMGFAKPQ